MHLEDLDKFEGEEKKPWRVLEVCLYVRSSINVKIIDERIEGTETFCYYKH